MLTHIEIVLRPLSDGLARPRPLRHITPEGGMAARGICVGVLGHGGRKHGHAI